MKRSPKKHSIEISKLSNEEILLLGFVLKLPKEKLLSEKYIVLRTKDFQVFSTFLNKLKKGLPLAYLTESKWFYGREFYVNRDVLIPRPDTEILIERALSYTREQKPDLICDIGTGSGAIIVTLQKEINETNKLVSKFIATDISAKTLKIARQNARKLKAKISFKKGNLAAPLQKDLAKAKNVLICANLPYLSKKQMSEPSIKYEPKLALLGGKKSYDKIERLLNQISKIKIQHGCILLETDPTQTKIVSKLAHKYLNKSKVSICKDLSSRERVVEIIF